MEFRVLGPVEVLLDGRPVAIVAARQQVVLALLLLEAGRVVSVERIIDALWGERPPKTARSQVQITISGLRRLIGDDAIVTQLPGYVLQVPGAAIDLRSCEKLTASAATLAAAQRTAEAVRDFRAALGLWRGPALEGVRSDVLRSAATRLNEWRISVYQDCLELELQLGRHQEMIGELTGLVAEYPLNERFRGQLMLAFYRSGRQADALATFRSGREVLQTELGLDPGPELCRLETAVLTRSPQIDFPGLRAPAGAPDKSTVTAPPRQLPRTIADFTGREKLLAAITGAVTGPGTGSDPLEVPVVILTGRGGAGKTALAVRAAHQLSAQFPDGQLFVQLRQDLPGNSSSLLEHVLRSLGVHSGTMPPDLEGRTALYRSVLAARRVLVVLDGAQRVDDILPFIPGTPGCATIATCTLHMAELEGVHQLFVGPLDDVSARKLLLSLISKRRAIAEPEAVRELISLCEGIPLALRIVAGKLAARPHWPVSHMARLLHDETRRLDELDFKGSSMRATIAVAYNSLDEPAQRLLRQLSVLRATDFASWVGAPLLDVDIEYAELLLQQLVASNLVEATVMAYEEVRFHLHDLVRIYAVERSGADESTVDRLAAIGRLLRCWLFIAVTARRRIYGGDFAVLHGTAEHWPLPPDSVVLQRDPITWFKIERNSLVTAISQAAKLGLDEVCWDLAATAVTVFESDLCTDDWRTSHANALSTVRVAGNRRGEAALLYSLGTLETSVHVGAATSYIEQALRIFEEIGDDAGQALTLSALALLDTLNGDYDNALARYRKAVLEFRRAKDTVSEAYALKSMAQICVLRLDYHAAERLLDDALLMARKLGTPRLTAQIEHALAELQLGQGRAEAAVEALSVVLTLSREAGDIVGEAFALVSLGNAKRMLGDLAGADDALRAALNLAGRTENRLVHGRSLLGLAELHLAKDEERAALVQAEEAIAVFHEHGARGVWRARALELLGRIYERSGQPGIALHAWRAAAQLAADTDSVLAGQIAAALERWAAIAD